ncbi:hypothetical protein [Cecembia lonarensis]|uniref:Uncharacterized protein n=1 Tax=Cecembia lonarensis (strain CCUG 58316 / KCTC 22772 / LW9) TaxID=1225176 RepID=K1LEU1_CECL9|nr:hypothetical protein [Cecembia lonarensis]EKB48873.1 hypothetical protein B879_02515 [Cecembia lonarensis LW9]
MKRILTVFLTLTIFGLFSSCDRGPERPDFYYRFKFNGVQKEFKASTDADITFIETQFGFNLATFTMVTGRNTDRNALVIGLRYIGELQTAYQMQTPIMVNNVLSTTLTFFFLDENGKPYLATLLQSENPGALDDGRVEFTAITPEGSYGTFEAIVFDPTEETSELSARQIYRITDGEFFLPNVSSIRTE